MFVYHRIFENPNPIDVAFLGTSHSGCAIDGKMLEDSIPVVHFANLAYCQPGENIEFVVLKDLLTKHRPKHIFYEVRLVRDFTTHRDFGTIADLSDVIKAPVIHNQYYLKDLFKNYRVRYIYFQDKLMNVLPDEYASDAFGDHNLLYDVGKVIDPERAAKHLEYQRSRLPKLSDDMSGEWKMQFPNHYILKVIELARENDIELTFLYIPAFGMVSENPSDLNFLKEYGEVVIPPASLFRNQELWMDVEHFNRNGATEFTSWLIETYSIKKEMSIDL